MEVQQPRASGALFPKDTSGPGDPVVQGKLVTMVEEEDEDVMLAAPVTLRDSAVEKRPQEKGTEQAVSQQLRPIYEDPQAHESNDMAFEAMDELKNILVPDEIQHAIPSVHEKSQQGFQHPDLMQLQGPKMGNSIGGMTQSDVEKSATTSMKVALSTRQEVFVDPFPKDLETLFLEEDTLSSEIAIKDENTVKHTSTLVEDTQWSVLGNDTGHWPRRKADI